MKNIFLFLFFMSLLFSSDIYKRDGYYFSTKTHKLLNGKVNFISTYQKNKILYQVTFLNGQKDGIEKIYNNDGLLIKIITYKNGNKNGKEIEYYKSGNKSIQNFYKNDVLIKRMFYNPSGELDGYTEIFYDTGALKVKSFYKNGKKELTEMLYYPNNSIYAINVYSKGKLLNSEVYDLKGNLISSHGSKTKTKNK